jgi:hypothetical protein
MKMEIKSNVYDEISEYCKLNDIENVENFIYKLIRTAFAIEKYGNTPNITIPIPEEVIEPIEEPMEEPIEELKVEEIIPIVEIKIENNKKPNDIDLYGE